MISGLPMRLVSRQQAAGHRQQGLHTQDLERPERQPRHGPAGPRRRGRLRNGRAPGIPASALHPFSWLTSFFYLSGLRRRLGRRREDGRLGREGQSRQDLEELRKKKNWGGGKGDGGRGTGRERGREPMIPCHAVLACIIGNEKDRRRKKSSNSRACVRCMAPRNRDGHRHQSTPSQEASETNTHLTPTAISQPHPHPLTPPMTSRGKIHGIMGFARIRKPGATLRLCHRIAAMDGIP